MCYVTYRELNRKAVRPWWPIDCYDSGIPSLMFVIISLSWRSAFLPSQPHLYQILRLGFLATWDMRVFATRMKCDTGPQGSSTLRLPEEAAPVLRNINKPLLRAKAPANGRGKLESRRPTAETTAHTPSFKKRKKEKKCQSVTFPCILALCDRGISLRALTRILSSMPSVQDPPKSTS